MAVPLSGIDLNPASQAPTESSSLLLLQYRCTIRSNCEILAIFSIVTERYITKTKGRLDDYCRDVVSVGIGDSIFVGRESLYQHKNTGI
ncbi:hypothetical protein L1987_50512 [Smallanthus sonchifolius]|uniref:Uncharacterized protein n=1 Tax=Smallanthus sonchifolius TaxID=185202 RepID=A0ACB9ENU7_9ASTR|nr:hypothetical protein L1987_50512 [Smallanthus sonchifolius]